jgi:hypothetical protein
LSDDGNDFQQTTQFHYHLELTKLPDVHAIRAIQLDTEIEHQLAATDGAGEEPPPSAA